MGNDLAILQWAFGKQWKKLYLSVANFILIFTAYDFLLFFYPQQKKTWNPYSILESYRNT